jgi:hypothetical protein
MNGFLLLLLAVFAVSVCGVLTAVALHRGRMPRVADVMVGLIVVMLAALIVLLTAAPQTLPRIDTIVTTPTPARMGAPMNVPAVAAAALTPDQPLSQKEVRMIVTEWAADLLADGVAGLLTEIDRLDMSADQMRSVICYLSGAAPNETARALARVDLFGTIAHEVEK